MVSKNNIAKKRIFFFLTAITIVGLTSFIFPNGDDEEKYEKNDLGLKVVVIDPGHGGKDPGCGGAHSKEKDVVLAIGLELGRKIKEKYPDIKVLYTRDDDVFVELNERARIANVNQADLFICIHANSGQPAAYGAETYVMGLHKSEANLNVAQRENAVITMEEDYETKYSDFDGSPDAMLALHLQQSAFLKQSISYASKVQHQLKGIGRRDRGVKQAGFVVLYRTKMPSVLIETGFLTNKEEEDFLANKENQNKMAGAFFKAFESYKIEIDRINKSLKDDGLSVDSKTKIRFKLQLATSINKIELISSNFNGLEKVEEYKSDGMYKYTYGSYDTFSEAKKDLEKVKKNYKGAFVVAFENGKRVSLQRARKITE